MLVMFPCSCLLFLLFVGGGPKLYLIRAYSTFNLDICDVRYSINASLQYPALHNSITSARPCYICWQILSRRETTYVQICSSWSGSEVVG